MGQLPNAVAYPDLRFRDGDRKNEMLLAGFVEMFPTPIAQSAAGGPRGLDGGEVSRRMLSDEERKDPAAATLNPELVEWLMGWPIGWTGEDDCTGQTFAWDEEPVPRVAVGVKNRGARLRMLGNGQVPQCAALAWRLLVW